MHGEQRNLIAKIGRRAAHRWSVEPDDGEQAALEIALRCEASGLRADRIPGRVSDILFSRRSPLADDRNRRESTPLSGTAEIHFRPGRSYDAEHYRRRRLDIARGYAARQYPVRAALRDGLLASPLAGQLDMLELYADLRCPSCRRSGGGWHPWAGDLEVDAGVRQTDRDYYRQIAGVLEPGASPASVPAAERPDDTGPRDVWVCASCGAWTRAPLARVAPDRSVDADAMLAHGSRAPSSAAEDLMIRIIDVTRDEGAA